MCYKNAFKVAEMFQDKDIKYCECFYCCHAINKCGDKYFDITYELNSTIDDKPKYYVFGEFDVFDCYNVQSIIGEFGRVYETLWKDKNNVQMSRYLSMTP